MQETQAGGRRCGWGQTGEDVWGRLSEVVVELSIAVYSCSPLGALLSLMMLRAPSCWE